MSKKKWSKVDEELLIEKFSSAKWEDLLKMLPDRKEHEILFKADKLGLKREPERIAEYYDEEKEGWVETHIHYGKIKGTVSSFYPAKKGETFEEAQKRVFENITNVFSKWYFETTNGGVGDPELDALGFKAFLYKQFNDNDGAQEYLKQIEALARIKAKQMVEMNSRNDEYK
jgi:hypothetical protein